MKLQNNQFYQLKELERMIHHTTSTENHPLIEGKMIFVVHGLDAGQAMALSSMLIRDYFKPKYGTGTVEEIHREQKLSFIRKSKNSMYNDELCITFSDDDERSKISDFLKKEINLFHFVIRNSDKYPTFAKYGAKQYMEASNRSTNLIFSP